MRYFWTFLILVSAMTAVSAAPAGSGADSDPCFPITHFRVEGNELLPAADLDAALAPCTGPQCTFADVRQAQSALVGLYRRAGFGAVRVIVPEQQVAAGTVTLRVIAPKVARVEITGNRFHGEANIRRALPALKEGAAPNTAELDRNLQEANLNPSRHLTATLEPADTATALNVKVRVEDSSPAVFSATVDNFGIPQTGRTRLSVGWSYANFLDRDHELTVVGTIAPEHINRTQLAGFGYRIPFARSGDSLLVYGGHARSATGQIQGLFEMNGSGSVGGTRYAWRLPSSAAYQQQLEFGFDWRRFDSAMDFAGIRLPNRTYTLQPASLGYRASGRTRAWSADFSAAFSQNLTAGGDFAAQAGRTGARRAYSIGRFGADLRNNLASGWTLRLRLAGQWTASALPAGEQFTLGGAMTVRGYPESVLIDDNGTVLSVEAYTPALDRWVSFWRGAKLRALVFFDGGRLSRNDPQPGEVRASTLAGAGVGLRFAVSKALAVRVDLADPLRAREGIRVGDLTTYAAATVIF